MQPGSHPLILSLGCDASVLERRNRLLHEHGYAVLSGAEENAVLLAKKGGFDLVLLCYSVTPAEQARVRAKLHRALPGVPVMALRAGAIDACDRLLAALADHFEGEGLDRAA